ARDNDERFSAIRHASALRQLVAISWRPPSSPAPQTLASPGAGEKQVGARKGRRFDVGRAVVQPSLTLIVDTAAIATSVVWATGSDPYYQMAGSRQSMGGKALQQSSWCASGAWPVGRFSAPSGNSASTRPVMVFAHLSNRFTRQLMVIQLATA